jgi:hypothetical protein
MTALDGGVFHIEQITGHIAKVSQALEDQDLPNLGLSLQTLSLAARVAQAQFIPAPELVALSWETWLASLIFLEQCVEGVMHNEASSVQWAITLLTLSQHEYVYLIELAEMKNVE